MRRHFTLIELLVNIACKVCNLTIYPALRKREAARCRCRVRALRPSGSRGGWHWQALVGRQSHLYSIVGQVAFYAAHNKRGQRRERM